MVSQNLCKMRKLGVLFLLLMLSESSFGQVTLEKTFSAPKHQIICAAYSTDSKYIATGGFDKKILIWDTHSGDILHSLSGLKGFPVSLVFNQDGKYLISGGKDNKVTIWNTVDGTKIRELKGHADDVMAVDINRNNIIVSASKDKTIRLWNIDGSEINKLVGHTKELTSVKFSPDGEKLISGSADGTLKEWDWKDNRLIQTIRGAHKGWTRSVAYNYNATLIASGGEDGKIQIWNAADGQNQNTILAHSNWVQAIVFSPDGKYIASGGHDNYLVLIDVNNGSIVFNSPKQKNFVLSVAFDPEGKSFISSNRYSTNLSIWDATSLNITSKANIEKIPKSKAAISWESENNTTTDKLSFQIAAQVTSASEISSIDIYLNGTKFSTYREVYEGGSESSNNLEFKKYVYLISGANSIRLVVYNYGGRSESKILSIVYKQPEKVVALVPVHKPDVIAKQKPVMVTRPVVIPEHEHEVEPIPKTKAVISWVSTNNTTTKNLAFEINALVASESEISSIDIYLNGTKFSTYKDVHKDKSKTGYNLEFKKFVILKPGLNNIRLLVHNIGGQNESKFLNVTYKKPEVAVAEVPEHKPAVIPEHDHDEVTKPKVVVKPKPTIVIPTLAEGEAVDELLIDLPTNSSSRYRFAIIIGNEDYSSYQTGLDNEVNVVFAENDARAFKEYATHIIGVPEENIIFMINARAIEMDNEIKKLNPIIKALDGKAEIFFYYAGHGLPHEETKEPYLIPVDVTGTNLNFAIKLTDLYASLAEYPSKKITVMLDACFSGGAREQGLIAARGVKIKPKENVLDGNLVIFSASSGSESALPYRSKKHGIFTYFLLKKLKESEGDISYKELSNYLTEEVGVRSVLINSKAQSPQTNTSIAAQKNWEKWRIH